jgi:hypothetical protein
MSTWFKLALIAIFALAVAIGALWGRSQSNFATASVPNPTPTPLIPPPPGGIEIVPNPQGTNPEGIYYPAVERVKVGGEVVWGNFDTVSHSVVADNGAFNSDVIPPRHIYIWRPKKPGTYAYGDFLQAGMQGKVIVQP